MTDPASPGTPGRLGMMQGTPGWSPGVPAAEGTVMTRDVVLRYVARPVSLSARRSSWCRARRGGTGDETDGRLLHLVARQELGGVDLALSADLADHDDLLRFRIGEEHLQHLDEIGAFHRIAADADATALPEADGGGLRHRLIGKRAGAGDDADGAAAVDMARHDADLA